MEVAMLLGCLIIVVIAVAMFRGWAIAERAARDAADQAETTLDTTRRIQDATRDPVPASDARDRLRRFGAGGATDQR